MLLTSRLNSSTLIRLVLLVLCCGLILSHLSFVLPGPVGAREKLDVSDRGMPSKTSTQSKTSTGGSGATADGGWFGRLFKFSARANLAAQPLPNEQSAAQVVISQVYGGGGNSGATYKNDFIEVFNRSNAIVNLTNWSVQYASASSGTWQVFPISGPLGPGQYLLVQGAQGAAGTTDLPTPDMISTISLNASSGKVALVNQVTALSGTFPLGDASIVDFVGYGSSASCYEGNLATPPPSNSNAVLRANKGCTDTNNNSTDFNAVAPAPRNRNSEASACGTGLSPSTTIVISEFRTRGDGGGFDEFVELYNKTDSPIDLSGWKIKASNSEGGVGTRVTINPGTYIPARGHFLATNENASGGYSGPVAGDQTFSLGIPDDGGIAIVTPDDTVVDRVGMSDGSAFKESRALHPSTGDSDQSYERKPGWGNGSEQDTNDNPSDFQQRYPSEPQNLYSAPSSPNNQLPIADPGGPYSFQTGTPVYANSWRSSDPDGTIVSQLWDYGDGTGARPTLEHIYSTAGTYTITLTVTDNAGGQATASTTATVTETPPTPTPTPTPSPTPTPTPTPSPDVRVVPSGRLEPRNRVGSTGEDLLSGNFNWSLPVVGLEGRAGLNLGLTLAYNSLTWTKDQAGQKIVFDEDQGFPSAGFRLGFPVIQGYYSGPIESTPPQHSYTVIMPSGERIGLWQTGSPYKYKSSDSSYLQLDRVAGSSTILHMKDLNRTEYKFVLYGDSYKCVEVKDRNGNYISASYDAQGRILTITDTLARVFTFNYAGGYLVSITQPWNGQPHAWARFEYELLTIQSNFLKDDGTSLEAVGNGQTINVLKRVVLADQSSYRFSYNPWGQVYRIAHHAADDHLLGYSSYDLPVSNGAPLMDCPRFTQRSDWAQYWNGDQDGVPAAAEEALTKYTIALDSEMGSVTLPDNATTEKKYFGTTTWQKGLTTKVETYYGGTLKRGMSTTWTQDDESLPYQVNPRIVETKTYDPEGNSLRTHTTYTPRSTADSIPLPMEVLLYVGDEPNARKRTLNYYYNGGLLKEQTVLVWINEPVTIANYLVVAQGYNKLASKVTYEYDLTGPYLAAQGEPPQHDSSYGTNYVNRGNLCVIRRWDINNATDISKSTKIEVGYNTTGSVILKRDALGSASRQTTISYTDSDGGNTLAYPTKITDPDGFSVTMQYDYDLGLRVRTRSPKGAEQVSTYDTVTGLILRQTLRDGLSNQDVTYTRFVYSPSQTEVESYTLIDSGVESHSTKRLDGAGNVIGVASTHPGSAGGYSGQRFSFDVLGRKTGETNPTEINNPAGMAVANWAPAGDDSGAWQWRTQQYDWKGRPTVATNVDGTVTEAVYGGGCGCAGGDTVTYKGEQLAEGRRTRKVYQDALGREYKTEVLDWNGNIYTTTVNSYDHRDQVIHARQYAGAEGSAPYQDTTYSYDGYGRLIQRQAPEQDQPTLYTYNADDSVQSVRNEHGGTTSYEYNDRSLLKKISYSSNGLRTPGPTTFSYDSVGNRTEMTDELGIVNYEYDGLSRLRSETRQFNETVAQAPSTNQFKLQYTYTLSGQLSSITDAYGEQVAYNHDGAGRLSSVSGTLPDGEQVQYATNAQYRAWGALKGLSYGTGLEMRMNFNNRLEVEQYSLSGRRFWYTGTDNLSINYQYYADGRLRFSEESHSQANQYQSASFARSYEYDFVGRLSLAKTGNEARGQVEQDFTKRPYRQSFTYDVFGHMTQADRWHWTEHYVSSTTGELNGTYDAGGRVYYRSVGTGYAPSGTAFWYDGTGKVLKSLATNDACEPETRCKQTTYFICSSVLGGEVVNEIIQTYYPTIDWATGAETPGTTDQKRETYIRAGGARIAKHEVMVSERAPSYNHDTTYIENRDASGVVFDEMILRGRGAAYGTNSPSIYPNFYIESDPFGASVGLTNPYVPPPDDGYGPPRCSGPEPDDCGYPEDEEEDPDLSYLDYDEGGYGNPVAFTCYVDGFPRRCEEVFDHIDKMGEEYTTVTREREFAAPSTTGPQAIWNDEYSTQSFGDVANDIDPNGSPNQLIAQVNVGIVDEGYFVIGGANWDTQAETIRSAYASSQSQQTKSAKKSCTFNINISGMGLSEAQTSAMNNEMNRLFKSTGHRISINTPGGAATNYSLILTRAFPTLTLDERNEPSIVGNTPLRKARRSDPGYQDAQLFDGKVPGEKGYVYMSRRLFTNIKDINRRLIVASRVGVHELIHYLWQNRGHGTGLMREGIDDYDKDTADFSIDEEIVPYLDEWCNKKR